jgi:hypothetical protein
MKTNNETQKRTQATARPWQNISDEYTRQAASWEDFKLNPSIKPLMQNAYGYGDYDEWTCKGVAHVDACDSVIANITPEVFATTENRHGNTLKQIRKAIEGCDASATAKIVEAINQHAALVDLADAAAEFQLAMDGKIDDDQARYTEACRNFRRKLTALELVRKGGAK